MADDRAQGLMVGLAVGNLLGISTEGWSRSSIARAFPGGMQDIVARPGFPDDDDLAQAIIIAEAATGGDGLDIDDLGRRFWHWAEVNGAGMGRLTGAVCRSTAATIRNGSAVNARPANPASRTACRSSRRRGRDGEVTAPGMEH